MTVDIKGELINQFCNTRMGDRGLNNEEVTILGDFYDYLQNPKPVKSLVSIRKEFAMATCDSQDASPLEIAVHDILDYLAR